jgi:uncharacterized repeat protein (TIGR03847 family)
MARRIYDFEGPDRFVAGAIGEPGGRTFFLQARDGSRVVSVLIEKVQVALLAERLTQLLTQLRAAGAGVPEDPVPADLDTAPLDEPINPVLRVGTMAIVWDVEDEVVVVEARDITEEDDDEGEADEDDDADDQDDEADVMRVHLTPARALAFAKRALEVVASGRPPCPFCGQPLNPEGHICVRRNGFMH